MVFSLRMALKTLTTRMLARIKGSGKGHVFTAKDFLDLGARSSVDWVLYKLTRSTTIRRIGHGIYDYPRVNDRLGITVAPDPMKVATAVARKSGASVAPSGAVAANQLGLTTQVPAKLQFLTDSESKRIKVGNQTFIFKHIFSLRKSSILPSLLGERGRIQPSPAVPF